jgi:hypothetical protein
MQINGFIAANPIVGGLEHEVTNNKKADFYYVVNSERTSHRSMMVRLFSL